MRRYQQNQLLELMGTIHEANSVIKRFLYNKDWEAAVQLLMQCQEGATRIGKTIEQLEGEGTKTVSYLEEYCELLYQASISLDNTEVRDRIYKLLCNQVNKVENSIQYDLKADRFEVVFLPYAACMWDSMESVWMAAAGDPQCDAYVVPIPYYDLLPEQVLGQMHYEGNGYPDYVPVTDWRQYKIADRRPDIIYVHNPYDEGNFITRVHPDFYCRELKKYTDMLVYIPYFVCEDDVPEHHCVYAGTGYADRVILQSEKVRDTYIRVFGQHEKANGYEGMFEAPEKRFLALGSPKFDKVVNTKREDCGIPEEWLKRIEKPDGSRKKVVLYNTTISELLNENDKVLSKLLYVFDCFRGREDAVLLWRPHPLNISAYQAMRPGILDAYQKIVTAYKQEGLGIYDETADLNRAIAISDAYLGDPSSLVALYQCTGKPIMIQDININEKNDDPYFLAFKYIYADNEYIWFTPVNFNALFKMKKSDWKAEYMGSFPNENRDGWSLYNSIAAYGSKLLFTPGSANEFAEYDVKNGSFKKIKLIEPEEQTVVAYRRDIKFLVTVQYKKWIFFAGGSYPAFIRYDTESGALDYFSDWVKPLNSLVTDPKDVYFRQDACVSGSCFTIASCNANAVVVFDMDLCTSRVYEVGSKKCRYSGICYDGKDYWMSPRNGGPIVRWNLETNEYKEYDCFLDGYNRQEYSFWNINYAEGFVWLLPNRANMALKINITDESVVIAKEFQPECEYQKPEAGIFCENYILSKVDGDVLYAHTGKSNKFVEYSFKTGRYREEHIKISEEDMKTTVAERSKIFNKDASACSNVSDCNFYEDAFATMEDFIKYVNEYEELNEAKKVSARQIEICRNTVQNLDGTAGSAIFSYCKQAVSQK